MNEDRTRARDELVDCALCVVITERAIPGGAAVAEAMDSLELAALRLVNIVSEAHPGERPEGWEPDPEAATA